MPSNFENIKDSGKACVGCGRTSDQVMLKKLRTYSLSFTCGACLMNPQYAACANENPLKKKCGHEPMQHKRTPGGLYAFGACTIDGCGCERWIHGLETEFDRQYAAGVGVAQRFHECNGFGANIGKCGTVILAKADGSMDRLCEPCMRRWLNETKDTAKQFQLLQKVDTKIEFPN